MLKNFITIALRQFKRNFIYTMINVIGLALGMAGSFVIGSWVWQELSYDKHFKDSEKIYRVSVSFYNSGAFASGPEVLNTTLNDIAPEVEIATRLDRQAPTPLFVGEKKFEENIHYADSSFFNVFSYSFVAGNPSVALSNPNQLVIDSELAVKIFGIEDVLGKSLEVGKEKKSYTISGVVKSTDEPSHMNAHIWLPMEMSGRDNWTSASVFNYIKLRSTATKSDLLSRLESIKKDLVYPTFQTEASYDEWKGLNFFDFHVVGLEDIHLDPDMRFEMQPGGNRANVYIFLVVALFLVVIAGINFINLSTAQSIKRAKEVGIRKALGTARRSLVVQFLSESVILSFLAMLIGIGLAEIFLILFQSFTSEVLINGIFTSPLRMLLYVLFSLFVGILAGIYPAFYLSRYQPSSILRSARGQSRENQGFRNVLVIAQFTVSIALIVGSLFVFKQLELLRNVDLGFDRDNVLIIDNASELGDNKEAFKTALMNHAGVENASYNKRMPAGRSVWIYSFQSDGMEESLAFQTFIGDDNFIPTMGFRLLKGRNFSSDMASDSSAIILNESAVKEMMLRDPIGAELKDGTRVIGVISDFGYQSFYEKPGPIVLIYNPDGYRLSIKVKDSYSKAVLDFVQDKWSALSVEKPLSYSFLDQNFEKLMEKEKTLGKTVSFFTTIAIFISCLGLFGLAAYTAEQRQKEIGVRKVLGAKVFDVVLLLNKNFTRQVVISIIIAAPLAWYFVDKWLQNFTYKIEIEFWLFLASGVVALAIAWLTVGYLSFKAASANPVDSLRDE